MKEPDETSVLLRQNSNFKRYDLWYLTLEFIVSSVIFYVGRYSKLPERWIPLNIRPIPFQELTSGDIILDPGLNHAYVSSNDVALPSADLKRNCIYYPLLCLLICGFLFNTRNFRFRSMLKSRAVIESHASSCVLLSSIGCSELITRCLKCYVGRLRPNFYNMCSFNLETLVCTASNKEQTESRMSFPSGHSSMSFCSMGVLTLYILGKFRLMQNDEITAFANPLPFDGTRDKFKNANVGRYPYNFIKRTKKMYCLCAIYIPLSYAFYASTSRLVDNWHHPSDVVYGSLLGVLASITGYHMFYPSVFSTKSGCPLAWEFLGYASCNNLSEC